MAGVQIKISLIEVLKTSYCKPDTKMQNLKEKNEITASKIKQSSLYFFIINVGWLKRDEQTNV